jgi:hypothetical protein
MKKLLILVFFISILFSGCMDKEPYSLEADITSSPVINVTPDTPAFTATPETIVTITPTPAINLIPQTEYDKFVSWLETDMTNKHSYVFDNSKVYEDQYLCSQYTRDFLKNATSAGFEVYAVGLTGAVKGQNEWHMLAAVVLDKNWYFVDPQTDQILKIQDMFHAYGYEYAYFGKEVFINRNNAEISMPVYYHSIIGLNDQNFLRLR